MLRITLEVGARFQPYAMAIQTRFRWRHKETDRWRRLMDATCFPVDWLGQTRGPTLSQFSGSWTHIVTCAHVVCPWDYPNYYPTTGPTRFVSRITLADTLTQVRLVTLQGNAAHKHFTSNQHVFVHSNPRLDLCVVHPEQNFMRSGEMKLMWMQNEGHVIRPRLELVETLKEGDHVWIYGMRAHESLFDEEKGVEPLMIPTGIRAKVHNRMREHFFLDTTTLEGEEAGRVQMGMCGSVVMRNGRCVGMVTALVHPDSECRELAGTAMCTYAGDIFEFLLEVEKQMKNGPVPVQQTETRFQQRRRDEGKEAMASHHDWERDQLRIARHIPAPISLWRMDQTWFTEEDAQSGMMFGRSGAFSQETQESALGYDINSAKTDGDRPGDIDISTNTTHDGKFVPQGDRPDYSPVGIYGTPETFKTRDAWDFGANKETRSFFDQAVGKEDVAGLTMLHKSLQNIRAQRVMDKMRETAMQKPASQADPRHTGDCGHDDGNVAAGAANFDAARASHGVEAERAPSEAASSTAISAAGDEGSCFYDKYRHSESTPSSAERKPESNIERKKRERREREAKYQADLRRRLGRKATPFVDEDMEMLWRTMDR